MHLLRKTGILFFSLISFSLYGQGRNATGDFSNAQVFMSDANGRPLYMHTEYEVEGTPFYQDEYCLATIKLRKGKSYHNIRVKLNLFTNRVIYEDNDGKEMEATTPIDRIEFMHCTDASKNKILVSGYPPVDELNEEQYYVLVDSGKATLLKYIQVLYRDTKFYGKANTTRVFEQKESYYIYVPGKGMQKLTKDNDAVIAALPAKKNEVARYITSNNLKCRREEDLKKVFAWYNSLD